MQKSQNASLVTVASWAEFPWLRAGFSTRQGGVSTVYAGGRPGELNLGWTPEDEEDRVAENRQRFTEAVAGNAAMDLVTVRQTHSDVTLAVRSDGAEGFPAVPSLTAPDGRAVLHGDGMMTDVPGLLLGIQTADCVPVLVADSRLRVVAAFHAGWRGTVARIVERGVAAMRLRYGSQPEDLIAAIGPAIASCCFEVGEEVKAQFESQFAYGGALFTPVPESEKLHADLFEANRRQLLDAGLSSQAITMVGECTACTRLEDGRRKYFSHRAEKGLTGRMISAVGVVFSV